MATVKLKQISVKLFHLTAVLLFCLVMSACIGSAIGVVVDTAIEVVKVPFKVVGAAVDVVTGDDFLESDKASNEESVIDQPTNMEAMEF